MIFTNKVYVESAKAEEEKFEEVLNKVENIEESFNIIPEMIPVFKNSENKYFVEFSQLNRYMESNSIDKIQEAIENIKKVNEEVEEISVVIDPNDVLRNNIHKLVSFIKEAEEVGVELFKSKFDMYNGAKIDENIAKLEEEIEKEEDETRREGLKNTVEKLKAAKEKFQENVKKKDEE